MTIGRSAPPGACLLAVVAALAATGLPALAVEMQASDTGPTTSASDATPSDATGSSPAGGPDDGAESEATRHPPFWKSLVLDHWRHVVVVFGASALDSGIDSERGPRNSPLFWLSPPSFDERIRENHRRGPGDTDPHGFVESNVTPLTRGIAIGAILVSNGKRWRDDVNDLIGIWEAQRFNVATTGIFKNLVGRERPRLEFAEEDGATPEEIERLESSDSNHQSFYSYHASSAFTTLSYADMVISRRLSGQPAARRWIRGGLYALAGYIAWSRVLQDGHYFTDIVVGSMAGIYVGRSFYSFNHHDGVDHWLAWDPRPSPRPSSRLTILPPIVTPGGIAVYARIGL